MRNAQSVANLSTQLRHRVWWHRGEIPLNRSSFHQFPMPPVVAETRLQVTMSNLLRVCRAQAALPAVRNWAHAAQTPPWPRLAGAECLGVSPSRPASGTVGCTQEMAWMP